MKYKDYVGFTKTYVLVHNTGFGVMEAPYEEHDVVFETDDYDDALFQANKLKHENNSAESAASSWCENTYHINVNTMSEEGKRLLVEFDRDFQEKFKDVINNPMYKMHTIAGQTVFMMSDPNFNEKKSVINNDYPTKIFWSEIKKTDE